MVFNCGHGVRLVLLLFAVSWVLKPAKTADTGERRATISDAVVEYVPDVRGGAQYQPVFAIGDADLHGITRRGLAPFQLCQTCKCCSANNATNCSSMPCCFGISCNLPDKPYGVCALMPRTCDCTSCT